MQNPIEGCTDSSPIRHEAAPTRRALEQPHEILDRITDSLFALDAEWRYTYFNEAAVSKDIRRTELLGKNMFEEFPFLRNTIFEEQYRRAMEEQMPLTFEGQAYGRWFEIHVHPSKEGLTLYCNDITSRKQNEEELRQQLEHMQRYSAELEQQKRLLEETNARLKMLATTDGLTGLHNHRSFKERLAQEFQRGIRYNNALSLLLLDVDNFKQFNDTFGHPEGDQALHTIACALKSCARTTDTVARTGGEEFGVLLPDTDAHQALELAERMRIAVESDRSVQPRLTVSLGIATREPRTTDYMALLKEADQALYMSKRKGKNCVTHYQKIVC